jgi:agmatinase
VLGRLRQSVRAASGGVLLDIDCDVFDPAYFPAVGHPQPFGLTPQQLLRVVAAVAGPHLRALAISEFLPAADVRDQSLRTLVWLIEWLLLRRYESKPLGPTP